MDEYVYDSNEFGKRLKTIRKQCGYTQEELAEMLYISVDTLSRCENGKSNFMHEHITRLCQILNISADYLFFGLKKELIPEKSAQIDEIVNTLNNCSPFDLTRINEMLKILLQTPAA